MTYGIIKVVVNILFNNLIIFKGVFTMAEQHTFIAVNKLKEFVEKEAKRLEKQERLSLRNIRQLNDARKFLDMLNEPGYSRIKYVSELKLKIADERKMFQEASKALERCLPGYQITLFEEEVCLTPEQQNEIIVQKAFMDERVKWLHKCLGICHSKDYFR